MGILVAPVGDVFAHDGVHDGARGALCARDVCCGDRGGVRGFLCVLAFVKIINNYKMI